MADATPPPTTPGRPVIRVEHAARVNFASAQNSVPVLKQIEVTNPTVAALTGLQLEMTATPAIIQPKSWEIPEIQPDASSRISNRQVQFDHARLAGLNEAERGQLVFRLLHNDETLAETHGELEFLARDEWGGLADMAQILAAFVAPNDPAVQTLLRETSDVLQQDGKPPALDGYQSKDRKRVWMLAAAAWSAVRARSLNYAEPPKSFERAGQKIRTPSSIVDTGLATCLDLALLMAGLLEAIGLHPAVIFTRGHAFCGAWLVRKTFAETSTRDITELRKAIAEHEFITFEATGLTRPSMDFPDAISDSKRRLSEQQEADFEQAIDLTRSRSAGIRPLTSAQSEEIHRDATGMEPPASTPLPPAPDFDLTPSDDLAEMPATPTGRIERWQRKLLDLSLRNRLLNFKSTKQVVPFVCYDVPGLEDLLADGAEMRIISLTEEDPVGDRDPEMFRRDAGTDIREQFVRAAQERREVCVELSKSDMSARLTTLYRKAKSDLAEGGANTLFLAAGFLRWKRAGVNDGPYRAPLLLLPVTLARRSAQSGFRLRHHEDDIRMNSTLLEFLKRDFEVSVPELEGDLPTDESGLDLPRIYATMRRAVRDIPHFEVVEDLALSTFSFAKYLMWKDLVDRTDSLCENRLVRHLIENPETPFAQHGAGLPGPEEIDQHYPPSELMTPLPADSSQLAAAVAAAEGHDMVIVGPPGTGKSQTIANMIALCLTKGKSVLFVSEKSAALAVVHRRLKQYGLGAACVELHSNKADRKSVLQQLGDAWDRGTTAREQEWQRVAERLQIRRDELNAYVTAMHSPASHGLSIFDAIGINANSPEKLPFALKFVECDAHDADSFRRLLELAEHATRTFANVGEANGLRSVTRSDWSFTWEKELLERAETLRSASVNYARAVNAFATMLGQPEQVDLPLENAAALEQLASAISKMSGDDYRPVAGGEPEQQQAELDRLGREVEQIRNAQQAASAQYDHTTIARMPVEELDRKWREASARIWPFSWLGKRHVRKLLQSYANSGVADPASDLDAIRVTAASLASIANSSLRDLPHFDDLNTDPTAAREYLATAMAFQAAAAAAQKRSADPSRFSTRLTSIWEVRGASAAAAQTAAELKQARSEHERAWSAYCETAGDSPASGLTAAAEEMSALIRSQAQIQNRTKWIQVRQQMNRAELTPMAEALEQQQLPPEPARSAAILRQAYMRWWLPLAIDREPALRAFTGWEHKSRIDEFRELDEEAQKLSTQQVLRLIAHDLPARDEVARKSELGVLRHQLGLQRPSMPIRTLISKLPETFTKLAPCVLMSPLSIAQYLPAGHALFDVVLFDEASQITTWDAIGAIARGRQSIIVGDPKQLPPTNFFGRAETDEEEIEEYEKDLPSILDEASVAGLPQRNLNWHYRSRDETLIAFSNHHYYGDRLITFPSPSTETSAVRFHHIKDGVYLRGTARANRQEARAVVAMIVDRLARALTQPEQDRETIGVITFNIQQQELILDLLDAERRANPNLEWFFQDEREEPLIVKNLENIQGDERDIMLFSLTFGADKTGRMTMNFGPMNKDGGEKRLNVAVTRARSELHVFASFTAEQIDLGRTRAVGVAHLKNFLDYAERGPAALPAMDRGSVGEADSLFESAVAQALEAYGWEVRHQIGVSGFRIDLGVVHPQKAGAYLAGIECDGATYHSSANARDRDRIREGVLRNLGWEIIRIWSTEWFRRPKATCDQVHTELEKLLAASDSTATVSANSPQATNSSETTTLASEEPPADDTGATADPGLPSTLSEPTGNGLDFAQFYRPGYTTTLERLILGIVRSENPIHEHRLTREVARRHGAQRAGRKMQQRVTNCCDQLEVREEHGHRFVWLPDTNKPHIPYRPNLEREVREIPQAEIAALLKERPSITSAPDSAKELAQLLGISRLGKSTREHLERVLADIAMLDCAR